VARDVRFGSLADKAIPHRAWFFEESAHLPPSLNMRRIPTRPIPVRWSLLGVVLIAIVVYGGTGLVQKVRASGAGHDHTVFSARLPNVPGKTLTAIVVEYPEAAHQRTVMPAASSRMYSPDKFARRIPRLGQCGSIAPGRPSLSPPAALTWLVQMRVTRSLRACLRSSLQTTTHS
jgi:hypothetical protein